MPKHCAVLPGASNEMFGSGTAELATALLQRLGAAIPGPRDAGSRHVAVLHMPSPYAPRPVAPRSALQRLAEVRPRVPSRPVLAALSVTALGAAAAVTATGQFGAVAPADATQTLSLAGASAATGALPAAGTAATAIAPAAAAAPAVAGTLPDLPTVKVSTIVGDATATAQKLATKALKARSAAAAAAAAARIVPDHVPVPTPDESTPKASKGSGVGGAALAAAMNKIGMPYSWGAVGPNAFDCSGLVQWAFKQAGVSLPRTSAAQSSAGTSVSKSQLRPGDLVFFYSPVSHVGIYVGDGKILNASQSGEPVKISNMEYMPFHNARRL